MVGPLRFYPPYNIGLVVRTLEKKSVFFHSGPLGSDSDPSPQAKKHLFFFNTFCQIIMVNSEGFHGGNISVDDNIFFRLGIFCSSSFFPIF